MMPDPRGIRCGALPYRAPGNLLGVFRPEFAFHAVPEIAVRGDLGLVFVAFLEGGQDLFLPLVFIGHIFGIQIHRYEGVLRRVIQDGKGLAAGLIEPSLQFALDLRCFDILGIAFPDAFILHLFDNRADGTQLGSSFQYRVVSLRRAGQKADPVFILLILVKLFNGPEGIFCRAKDDQGHCIGLELYLVEGRQGLNLLVGCPCGDLEHVTQAIAQFLFSLLPELVSGVGGHLGLQVFDILEEELSVPGDMEIPCVGLEAVEDAAKLHDISLRGGQAAEDL